MKGNELLNLKDKLDMSLTELKTLIVLLGFYKEEDKDPIVENSLWLLSVKIDEAKSNVDKFIRR